MDMVQFAGIQRVTITSNERGDYCNYMPLRFIVTLKKVFTSVAVPSYTTQQQLQACSVDLGSTLDTEVTRMISSGLSQPGRHLIPMNRYKGNKRRSSLLGREKKRKEKKRKRYT
jgi:hypothetical protein